MNPPHFLCPKNLNGHFLYQNEIDVVAQKHTRYTYQNSENNSKSHTFFICLNLYHNPNHLWFWWPLGCWGFGVVMNGLSVFSPFGNSWEKRKVREIMEKEDKEI